MIAPKVKIYTYQLLIKIMAIVADMEVLRSIPQPSLEEVCGKVVPLSLREQKRSSMSDVHDCLESVSGKSRGSV